MRKKVSTKMFVAFSGIILASYILSMSLTLIFTINHNISEKEKIMRNTADMVAASIPYDKNFTGSELLSMNRFFSIFESIMGAHFIIADTEGNIVLCTNSLIQVCEEHARVLSPALLNYSNSGQTTSRYIEDYTFTERGQFVVIVPLTNPANNQFYGSVIASSPVDEMDRVTAIIFNIIFMSMMFGLMMTFGVTYIVSRRVSNPILQLNEAAKKCAKGNFDVNLKIKSHDEFSTVFASFNEMAASLKRILESRADFINNVSHDLKTPMTVISGYTEGILDGTIPKEEQEYYLKLISEETKRLSKIINTLLLSSSIEEETFVCTMEPFDVVSQLQQIIVSLDLALSSSSVSVLMEGEEKLAVWADKDASHRIFYNIIDNAIKFANNETTLEINVAKVDKYAAVSVKNYGSGIPVSELSKVFDRFYKNDKSRGEDKKGTGLGLYIAKSLALKLGGNIKVQSIEGEYCCFTVYLPLYDK